MSNIKEYIYEEQFQKEKERVYFERFDCSHDEVHLGMCQECHAEVSFEPDDFSGATEGDR